jgi:hypothetical protein
MGVFLSLGSRAGLCLVMVMLVSAVPARAGIVDGPILREGPSPPAPGTFLTLDRVGETSAINFGVSFIGGFGDESLIDSAYRVDLSARWRSGDWGVYGQFSWNHIHWAVDQIPGTQFFLNDLTGASDLEVGGVYVVSLPGTQIYLRSGVILPTASNLQYGANIAGSLVRFTDFASLMPGTLWLRPGVSVRGAYGDDVMFFYQLDATVCLPFHTSDDYPEQDTIWSLNAALGAALWRGEVTAELANTFADVTYRSLAFTVSYRVGDLGKLRPYLGVVVPFIPDATSQAHVVSLGVNGIW